jgi:hypothetical protein
MTQTHFSQITPIPPSHIDTVGAVNGNNIVFNGTSYVPLFPVSAFNNGTPLGRVEEINITGAGGFASVSGKRMTINVGSGFKARSTSPLIPYQDITFLDIGAGLLAGFSPNTLTISASAATPVIGISNAGSGAGIVENPGASSSFTLRSISAGLGITVTQIGSVIQISSNAGGGGGGGLSGVSGNGLTVFPNAVTLALATNSSAGAAPALTGISTDYLAGDGVYRALPSSSGVTTFNGFNGAIQLMNGMNTTVVPLGGGQFRIDATGGGGGGGAVNQVTSGAPSVLTVSPTSGNVVITPNGQSVTLNSAWNPSTRLLSIPVGVYQNGILTSSALNQFDLSATGGYGTVEVRYNGVTINPAAAILNFTGAGVTNVFNGVGTEINIAGGGGGGIAGISVNGVGAYNNLIFNGAGVTVSGNQITIPGGGGGGGGLVGTSGNGLVVTSNSVSLNLASISSPGAMPALPNNPNLFLNGVGAWAAPSGGGGGGIAGISVNGIGTYTNLIFNGSGVTVSGNQITIPGGGGGGGGAVNQVTSGNASVLQVSPTSGNVVITPIGTTASFTPSLNYSTAVLSLASTTHNGGILSSQGTQFIDLLPLLGITVASFANQNDAGASMLSSNTRTLRLRAGTGVTLTGSTPLPNVADIVINAAGGGGGGIAGISVNGVGAYNNLIFNGSGVTVSGNQITIPGGGGGGGGAVNQVTSGAPSVLTVSPTSGNVVITPIGTTASFTPSLNYSTAVLSLASTTHNGGMLSSQGTQFIDLLPLLGITVASFANQNDVGASMLSSNTRTLRLRAGTGVTLTGSTPLPNVADIVINAAGGGGGNLPAAAPNDFLFYNGTSWAASNVVKYTPTSAVSAVFHHKDSTPTNGVIFASSSTSLVNQNIDILGSVSTQIKGGSIKIETNNGCLYADVGLGSIETGATFVLNSIVLGRSDAKIGFFGKFPVSRPNVTAGSLASLQTALANLGLINLV